MLYKRIMIRHVLTTTEQRLMRSKGHRLVIMHSRGRVEPVHHGRPRKHCDCASVDGDDIDFVCGICAKF